MLVSDFIVDKTTNEVVSTSMDYIFSKKTKSIKRINKKVNNNFFFSLSSINIYNIYIYIYLLFK